MKDRSESIAIMDLRKYDNSWFDRGRPGWFVLLWWLLQGLAFPLSLHNLNAFRRTLLRLFGAKIGIGVIIRPTARFTYPWKVEIGDYSWIGDDVVFYSLDRISFGSHSVISQKSYLCTGSHNPQDITFKLVSDPIIVGNGVWIAADCFIAPGVKIGDNAVIGARSSVFKDVSSNFIAWGNPCTSQYPRKIHE